VKVDKAMAAQLYERAAEQRHAYAQHLLGGCYATGEGVKLDEAKAAQLFGRAAKQGHADAQYNLDTCLTYDEGA
jgi:TPR repeat protein